MSCDIKRISKNLLLKLAGIVAPNRAQHCTIAANMGCCDKMNNLPISNGNNVAADSNTTYDNVQEYYGKVLATSKDLKTSACTASGRPHPKIIDIMRKIPAEVMDKFYGCGAPLPLGIDGLKVLDLGSGSGRDAYVCAALVGEQGQVTGIDMTQEQIQVFVCLKVFRGGSKKQSNALDIYQQFLIYRCHKIMLRRFVNSSSTTS